MSCRIDWPSLARAFHKIIRGFAGRLALRLIDGASKVINSQVANMFGVKSKTLAEQGLAVAYCRVLLRSQSLHGCSPWVRRIILGSIRCHQGAHDMAPRIDALKLHDAVWPLGHVIDASPGRSPWPALVQRPSHSWKSWFGLFSVPWETSDNQSSWTSPPSARGFL